MFFLPVLASRVLFCSLQSEQHCYCLLTGSEAQQYEMVVTPQCGCGLHTVGWTLLVEESVFTRRVPWESLWLRLPGGWPRAVCRQALGIWGGFFSMRSSEYLKCCGGFVLFQQSAKGLAVTLKLCKATPVCVQMSMKVPLEMCG